MTLDPVVLSSITTAVGFVAQEYFKGATGEAGKATFNSIKKLFGWQSDPRLAEIPEKVVKGLSDSPEITEELIELLKHESSETAASLVQNVTVTGGRVVIANTVHTLNM